MSEQDNGFVKNAILLNAIGDVIVGVMLTFLFETMAQMMNFVFTDQAWFLSGGWGVAAISYAILRFYTFNKPKYYDLTIKFGLAEGGLLIVYCLVMWAITELIFAQVAVSLFFALFFTILYVVAYLKLN